VTGLIPPPVRAARRPPSARRLLLYVVNGKSVTGPSRAPHGQHGCAPRDHVPGRQRCPTSAQLDCISARRLGRPSPLGFARLTAQVAGTIYTGPIRRRARHGLLRRPYQAVIYIIKRTAPSIRCWAIWTTAAGRQLDHAVSTPHHPQLARAGAPREVAVLLAFRST